MLNISVIGIWNRLGSALIDFALFLFITMIGYAVSTLLNGFLTFFNPSASPGIYLLMLVLALFYAKDSKNGRSIGKRFSQLQVIDHKTGAVASPLQCVVRNFFLILGPLELIFALLNPARRLGDLVAGTQVAAYDPRAARSSKPTLLSLLVSFFVSCAFVMMFAGSYLTFASLEGETFGFNYGYEKNSLNQQAGGEVENLLNDKLGNDFNTKVVVHDKMENSDKKHIYVLLSLQENILEDEDKLEALGDRVLSILHERYKKGSFKAELNVSYKPNPSTTNSKIITIAD